VGSADDPLIAKATTVIAALESVGDLSPEEALRCSNHILQTAKRRRQQGPPTGAATPVENPETEHPQSRPFTLARFERVIPGPLDARPFLGGQFRVLIVELYDVQVVVQWRQAPEPTEAYLRELVTGENAQRETLLQSWSLLADRVALSDDVGTTYRQTVTSGHGHYGEWVCRQAFVPAVPDAADQLYLAVDEERFEIAVRPAADPQAS
jgi:hypothetical protein